MADETATRLDSADAGGRVIRGGALRLAGFAATNVLSILSFGLITRHLGVERFADFQTAISVVTVVSGAIDAGIGVLAVREYAVLEQHRRHELLRQLLGLRIALALTGIGIAVVVGAGLGFDGALMAGTALAGLGFGLNVVQSMMLTGLQAQLRLGTVAVLQLVAHVVLVGALVIAVAGGAGVTLLLAAYIPGGLAGVIAARAYLGREAAPAPAADLGQWLTLTKLAGPVALATAAGTAYLYVAQVVCDVVASGQESGLYAVGFRVFIVIAVIPGILVATAFPVLARSAATDADRFAMASGRLLLGAAAGGGLLAVGLSSGAEVAVDVVAGPDFRDAVPALRVQGLALIATFVAAACSFSLLSLKRNRQVVLANLVALVVTGVAVAMLADQDGARGAAIGSIVGESVLALGLYALLTRADRRLALRAADAVRVVLAIAVGLAVSRALRDAPGLVEAAAATTAYLVVALATGAVPREVLTSLRTR